jgi:hypothetical protein
LTSVDHYQFIPTNHLSDILVQPPAAKLKSQGLLIDCIEPKRLFGGSSKARDQLELLAMISHDPRLIETEEGKVLNLLGGKQGRENLVIGGRVIQSFFRLHFWI